MKQYTLANGVQIPAIGLGTWQTPDDETGYRAVLSALQFGYRHIDTAQGYRNEDIVGRAVKDSGIARDEVFITSKLDNPNHGYDNTMRSFEETLKQLARITLIYFSFIGRIRCNTVKHGSRPMLKRGRLLKNSIMSERSERSV